jgi:uncharacterized delta-60 repeat protein
MNGARTEGVFGDFKPVAVAVDSMSRVFVLGNTQNCFGGTSGADGAIIRLKADGTVDTAFGAMGSGRVCLGNATGVTDIVHAMAFDGNGKIVVVGVENVFNGPNACQLLLTRLDATTGAVDTTFNGTDMTGTVGEIGFGVALSADGHIYVAGATTTDINNCATPSGSFTARFTSGAAIDTTYGTSGFIAEAIATTNAFYGMGTAGNDSIAVGTNGSSALIGHRSPTGASISGKLVSFGSGTSVAKTVATLPNATSFIAGEKGLTAGTGAAAVARVFDDGGIDPADFPAEGGVFSLDILNWDDANELVGMAVDSSGRPLLLGRAASGDPTAKDDVAVARVTAAGALDTTWGKSGIARSGVAGNEVAMGVALDPTTGKIVAVGQVVGGTTVVIRLHP